MAQTLAFFVLSLIMLFVLFQESYEAGRYRNNKSKRYLRLHKRQHEKSACGKAWKLSNSTGKVEIDSGKAPESGTCEWFVFGEDNCVPEITCKNVNLKSGDDCSLESLTISDGVIGEEIFCGKANLSYPVTPSGEGTDLFITYKTSGTKAEQFLCDVDCMKKGARPLYSTIKVKKEHDCICGLQKNDNPNNNNGGEAGDADEFEFPWQAAVVMKGTRKPICGATLINSDYVLTAAHCFWFEDTKPCEIEILFHAYRLNTADLSVGYNSNGSTCGFTIGNIRESVAEDAKETSHRYEVDEIFIHPLFNAQFDYDYAVIKLASRVNMKGLKAPTPVCLPPPGNKRDTFDGTIPLVVGWGRIPQNGSLDNPIHVLRKLPVPVIPLEKCSNWFPHLITKRMICAGYEEGIKDSCAGDSGGPLIVGQQSKQWWQIGIVSWGQGCGQAKKPGVYSRVTEMMPWIMHHSSKGDPTWCPPNQA